MSSFASGCTIAPPVRQRNGCENSELKCCRQMSSPILMIASGLGFNGANKYCYELVLDLRLHGVDVLPVCLAGSWLNQQFDAAGIELVTSPLSRYPLTELKRVATLARERGVSVVHTHNSRAHSFGVLLKLLHGFPVVATAHQRHIQLHWCLNDFVIANSDVTLRWMHRFNFVRTSRLRRVYCPIRSDFLESPPPAAVTATRSSLGLSASDLVIGCVGNVLPRKSQLDLIRALPAVLRAFPQARVLMIGDDQGEYAKTCRKAVQELGLQNVVRWLGHQDEMPRLMSCLDVCVCTSKEESFGLTAAEALAAGVPVVATRIGGLREIVLEDATGLLVSPHSPAELSAAITRLLKDARLRARLGQAGRERVRTLFNPANHRAQLLDVYQTVARNQRRGNAG